VSGTALAAGISDRPSPVARHRWPVTGG